MKNIYHKQFISQFFVWIYPNPDKDFFATFIRFGKHGHSEHTYQYVTDASAARIIRKAKRLETIKNPDSNMQIFIVRPLACGRIYARKENTNA